MKVYLDDMRRTPEGWHRTYNAIETIDLIRTGQVTELSLDHDLGLDLEPKSAPVGFNGEEIMNPLNHNGYMVAAWLEAAVVKGWPEGIPFPAITLHTDNPTGRKNMLAAIKYAIRKLDCFPRRIRVDIFPGWQGKAPNVDE